MGKHRALVIGAGRIGAGFKWHDDAYTHAGAYRALSDRVELVGFVEPDLERRVAANLKWDVFVYDNTGEALSALKPDIVSVCVQPEYQIGQINQVRQIGQKHVLGIWCEKPYVATKDPGIPTQVNYMRRGDPDHRLRASHGRGGHLIVYGKDDIHTRCHFEDLAKWWGARLDYRVFNGPCAYFHQEENPEYSDQYRIFDNGGVDGGTCFKAMLGNLLDHIDKGTELWSPPNS